MNVSGHLAEPPIVDSLDSDNIGQGEKPLACLVHSNTIEYQFSNHHSNTISVSTWTTQKLADVGLKVRGIQK
jgi:hypothetical protein